jgi:DNA-binding transcriptional LysR family regulator
MELRQLRAFIEAADSGHFGRAAERLHITQPALTQRLQSLERELGVHLLERNAREVRLAPAGTILLPHARRMVEAEDLGLRTSRPIRLESRDYCILPINRQVIFRSLGPSSQSIGAAIRRWSWRPSRDRLAQTWR